MAKDLRLLYEKICLSSVFFGVKQKSPVAEFIAYCESESLREKRKKYAEFARSVYENANGDLTTLVKKAVFEDENAYIKSIANGVKVLPCVQETAERELKTFSQFASLTVLDFALDMGENAEDLPAFVSVNEDLVGAFRERMEKIHYFGYGIFSANGMFRFTEEHELTPIASADKVSLSQFVGYEEEREKVFSNTVAFLEGKPAANVLLYGDAGTGKSSTVKGIANELFGKGLRLIELRKDQLKFLPMVMEKINGNPLKFIIFIDDLSFHKSDDNFSMLKAALEGSASATADNAVIYATSNRRHIIKENFSDREGDDVHKNDTLQETLSLSERFALTVRFSKPDKATYLHIVRELAKRYGVALEEEELARGAEEFALRKGSRSARCAEQYINGLRK